MRMDNKLVEKTKKPLLNRWTDLDKEHSNRQDYTLLWLDIRIDKCDERTRKLIRKLSDYVTIFTDIVECHKYLNDQRDPVFLIISGSCANQCFPVIHNLPTVDSIFIYCASPSKYKHLMNAYKKVVSCVSTERELLNQVHWWTELKCSTQFYTCGNDLHRLTRDSSLFLAYLILVDGIPSGSTKEDMVNVCRTYYAANTAMNEDIDEFAAKYNENQAIHWYTKSSFVYKMLKKVLRLFDLDKLYAFSFYIRDLQSQLERFRYIPTKEFFVYRGLTMTLLNIAQLQANVGNLVVPNGFLSTSRNRDIALNYAQKQGILDQKDKCCNVLLEIEIGKDVCSSCIFADIAHASAFPDEREILFSPGTIFRVNKVELSSETGIYIINMKAANNKEYDLINGLLTMARNKFDEHCNQQLILKLIHFAHSSKSYFKFDRLWTWSDIKDGMYATSHRAVKALVSGAYRFTRSSYSPTNTEKISTGEHTELNKFEPGFCYYSGSITSQIKLKLNIDDNMNWINSAKLNSILASTDFQESPRPYFIVSNTVLPDHIKILGSKWLHIYYNNSKADFDQLCTDFRQDLAQYYRQTAQRIIREQSDRSNAKYFLLKSVQLYDQLEKESKERLDSFKNDSFIGP